MQQRGGKPFLFSLTLRFKLKFGWSKMLKAMNAVQLHTLLGKLIVKNSELPRRDFDIDIDCPVVLTVGSDTEEPDYQEYYIYSVGGSEQHCGVVLSVTDDPSFL
jgi:hypothetical protein